MIHTEFVKKALHELEKSDFGPPDLTKEDIALLYSLGFSLYQTGDLHQAEIIFRRLVVAESLEKKYWWAFGAVLQAKQDYQNALTAWSMCCLLDEENPHCHFHAAECFLSLKHIPEALKALSASKERCSESEAPLKQKILVLEQLWSTK